MSRIKVLFCVALTALALVPAMSQDVGILVKPVLLEVQPRPGERVTVPVEVRSTSPSAFQDVEVRLWPLYQGDDGRFSVVDMEATPDPPPPPGNLCLPWTSVDAEGFRIPPGEVRTVRVTLSVPSNASGFYSGALIVQTKPEARPGVITIRLRFLVPILVQIQGRAVTRRVEVRSVNMTPVPEAPDAPAGTELAVALANTGESLASVKGSVRVFAMMNDRWRRVADVSLPERRLLPGGKAEVRARSEHRFPPGKYRLVADVTLDGARLPQLSRELEYVGDPDAKALVADAEMVLEPASTDLRVAKGATRTVTVRFTNRATDPVVLSARATLPSVLQGVAYEQTRGEDLDGSPWVECAIPPGEIAPGRTVAIRLVTTIPAEAKFDRAAYFASVVVEARTSDGRLVGTAPVLVTIRNQTRQGEARITRSGRISVNRVEAGAFDATARFANIGDVPALVEWSADLLQGATPVASLQAPDRRGLELLPLETAVFATRFSAAGLKAGTYLLRFTVTIGEDRVESVTGIRVTEGPNGKEVDIIQPPSEGGGGAPTETSTTNGEEPMRRPSLSAGS